MVIEPLETPDTPKGQEGERGVDLSSLITNDNLDCTHGTYDIRGLDIWNILKSVRAVQN